MFSFSSISLDRESVLLGSVDAIDWVLRFCFRVSNSRNRSFIYCCSDPVLQNVDVEKPSLTD
ncbi:hypothetical protein Bca4012_031649 [Brassica carinata]